MKKLVTLAAVLQLGTASASLVAVMDTGTDISHKDLAAKAWTNKNEREGSQTDLDGSGLPGDVHGWDFTEQGGSSKVFNDKYNYLITADIIKYYDLIAKLDLKTINQQEYNWLRTMYQNPDFNNKANFVGGYAHGTHVGGVSALNNDKAQIMSLKILPTVYKEYVAPKKAAVEAPADSTDPVQLELNFDAIPVEDLIAGLKPELIKMAEDDIKEMTALHGYLDFHKVDVVNQSFGTGYHQIEGAVQNIFLQNVNRKATDAEMKTVTDFYFGTILSEGPAMFAAAPNTLFIVAAGNDSSDNDKFTDYPASIAAVNKISVAATLGYKELADFSNYGATTVDVAAPGVAIRSTGPKQTYIYMSGTSQATPFVTNTVALVKDTNPALKADQIKAIILGTVDVKDFLKGKVKTSGIVNKARAVKAAELTKTLSLDNAISKARADIADVAVEKSFNVRQPWMKLNIKPVRPSTLVIKPAL